jgi:hypothetical protein
MMIFTISRITEKNRGDKNGHYPDANYYDVGAQGFIGTKEKYYLT